MKLKKVFMWYVLGVIFFIETIIYPVTAMTIEGTVIPKTNGFSCIYQFSFIPFNEDIGGIQLVMRAKTAYDLTSVVATIPEQGAWSQVIPHLVRSGSQVLLSGIAPTFSKSSITDKTMMFELQLDFTSSTVPANPRDALDSLCIGETISTHLGKIQIPLSWGAVSIQPHSKVIKNQHCAYSNKLNRFHQLIFSLKAEAVVKAKVVDVRGKTLKVLLNSKLPAGMHTVGWDGSLSSNSTVASGTYFLQLETEAFTYNKKVNYVK